MYITRWHTTQILSNYPTVLNESKSLWSDMRCVPKYGYPGNFGKLKENASTIFCTPNWSNIDIQIKITPRNEKSSGYFQNWISS